MASIPYIEHLSVAIVAAIKAGGEILDVYKEDFSVEYKDDDSPLTQADTRADEVIKNTIESAGLKDIPILSEEGRAIPFDERKGWSKLWIVDPLDGTKEFVKKNGEFTVNIALIEDNRPVMGVVYAPAKELLYYGLSGLGAFRVKGEAIAKTRDATTPNDEFLDAQEILPLKANLSKDSFTVAGSRSHGSDAQEKFVEDIKKLHPNVEFITAGSSLKFCLVAEGSANVYPRLAPTMEWDTAAGQAVVEAAGGKVVVADSGEVLGYNREDLLNPHFIVTGAGVKDIKP
jgi:3'(2'), 5'-bisphosphate nucleotidase